MLLYKWVLSFLIVLLSSIIYQPCSYPAVLEHDCPVVTAEYCHDGAIITIQSNTLGTIWIQDKSSKLWYPQPKAIELLPYSRSSEQLKSFVVLVDPALQADYITSPMGHVFKRSSDSHGEIIKTAFPSVNTTTEPATHMTPFSGRQAAIAGFKSGALQLLTLPELNHQLKICWIDRVPTRDAINCIATINDSSAVIAYHDGTITRWFLSPPQTKWQPQHIGHEKCPITAMAPHSEKQFFVTTADGSLKFWRFKKIRGWCCKCLIQTPYTITALENLTATSLIAGDIAGNLIILENLGNRWLCTPVAEKVHTTAIKSITCQPDGQVLITADQSCKVQIWESPQLPDPVAGKKMLLEHQAERISGQVSLTDVTPGPCIRCETDLNPLCRVLYEVLQLPGNPELWDFAQSMLSHRDINFRDDNGTLLNRAVRTANSASLVRALLLAGADPEYLDQDGFTPMHQAIHRKNTEVLQVMVEQGIPCTLPDFYIIRPTTSKIFKRDVHHVDQVYTSTRKTVQKCWEKDCQNFRLVFASGNDCKLKANPAAPRVSAIFTTPNQRDSDNFLPLEHAIAWDDPILIGALISSGANPASRGKDNLTQLHWALEKDRSLATHIVRAIGIHFDGGNKTWPCDLADLKCLNCKNSLCELLHETLRLAYMSQEPIYIVRHVQAILDKNDLDTCCNYDIGLDGKDETLLQHAIITPGLQPLIRLLLRAGADPNQKGWCSINPLHLALHHRLPRAMFQVMVRHGAVLDGETFSACKNTNNTCHKLNGLPDIPERKQVIRFLLEENVNTPGADVLKRAICNGSNDYPQLLMEIGADPSLRDKAGLTPIHWTMRNKHVAMLRSLRLYLTNIPIASREQLACDCAVPGCELIHNLIKKGYRFNPVKFMQVDTDDFLYDLRRKQVLLITATQENDQALVTLLLQAGASSHINCQSKTGHTALHHAAENDNYDMVNQLIRQGASLSVYDSGYVSPLHIMLANFPEAQLLELLQHYPQAITDARAVLLDCSDEVVPALAMLWERPEPVSRYFCKQLFSLCPEAQMRYQEISRQQQHLPALKCPVFYQYWRNITPFYSLPCGHLVCKPCQQKILENAKIFSRSANCFLCQKSPVENGIALIAPPSLPQAPQQLLDIEERDNEFPEDRKIMCHWCSTEADLHILSCGHLSCHACSKHQCPQCKRKSYGSIRIFH
ncbi:ankyrin repeat domain-containing protein [Spongorhabdus nitratireducens]